MLENGFKINKLTVIGFDHKDKRYRHYYLFKCDCGKSKIIHGAAVISGNTKSCGCLSSENHRNRHTEMIKTKQGTKTAIYLQYKRHAISRGYSFNLSKDELISISQQNCFYCGEEPNNLKKTKNDREGFLYSGIDRKNNTKGYSLDNCVPCCKICNYAKSNLSLYAFQQWAIKLGKRAMGTK